MNRSFPFVLLPKRVVCVDNDGRMLDILRMRSLLRDVELADRQGDNTQAEGERPGCKQAFSHLVSTASLSPFRAQTPSAALTTTWLPEGLVATIKAAVSSARGNNFGHGQSK